MHITSGTYCESSDDHFRSHTLVYEKGVKEGIWKQLIQGNSIDLFQCDNYEAISQMKTGSRKKRKIKTPETSPVEESETMESNALSPSAKSTSQMTPSFETQFSKDINTFCQQTKEPLLSHQNKYSRQQHFFAFRQKLLGLIRISTSNCAKNNKINVLISLAETLTNAEQRKYKQSKKRKYNDFIKSDINTRQKNILYNTTDPNKKLKQQKFKENSRLKKKESRGKETRQIQTTSKEPEQTTDRWQPDTQVTLMGQSLYQ
ncbi:hypothetical protein RFI_12960 [Reticulomyxa filosa]|uniref:Uncharacterized protein n=1 Tax=Reticulomyxa filosa TaxID=46433 RepID=X6NE87_RETFI|nr:hypothetical protein RFI_12960 [Reticulomyxa filosa]|eukprot:ETO24203.1 hypothetical protein RFI_12960 [Reticulomyxa filosa]